MLLFIENTSAKNNIIKIIKKNSLINTKNCNSKWINEAKNINSKINILNAALNNNKTICVDYNIIYSNSIYYNILQKKNIENKIYDSNLSIIKELKILYKMQNIINNHPYNYLEFFQAKCYSVPKIYLNRENKSDIISNIKTYNYKINRNSENLSNISFQSEEALIGFGNINSEVSSTKSLVFSKININYNNIFYFSSYLNNLVSLNLLAKNHYSFLSNLFPNRSIFINKDKINYKQKITNSKNKLSDETSKENIISNKPYIIASPLFIGSGIIVSILAYYGCRAKYKKWVERENFKKKYFEEALHLKKKSLYEGNYKWRQKNKKLSMRDLAHKPNSKSRAIEIEMIQTKNTKVDEDRNSSKKNNDEHLENDYFDSALPSAELTSDMNNLPSTDTVPVVPAEPMEISTKNKVDLVPSNPDNVLALNLKKDEIVDGSNDTVPNIHFNLTDYIRNLARIQLLQFGNNSSEWNRNAMAINSDTSINSNAQTQSQNILKEELGIPSTKALGEEKLISNFLSKSETYKNNFLHGLYDKRSVTTTANRTLFDAQVLSFLYQKKLSYLDARKSPDNSHIFSEFRKTLKEAVISKSSITDDMTETSKGIINYIEPFINIKPVGRKITVTTHGWFRKPSQYFIRQFPFSNCTKEEHDFVQYQLLQLQSIQTLLASPHVPEKYYIELLEKSKKRSGVFNTPSETSEVEMLIVNEMIYDLNEVMVAYITAFKSYADLDVDLSVAKIEKIRFGNAVKSFKNIQLVRTNFMKLDHTSIDERTLYAAISRIFL